MSCLSDTVFLLSLPVRSFSPRHSEGTLLVKFYKKEIDFTLPRVPNQKNLFTSDWKCVAAWSRFFPLRIINLSWRKCECERDALREWGISAKPWRTLQYTPSCANHFVSFRSASSIPHMLHFAIGNRRMKRSRQTSVYMQAWHRVCLFFSHCLLLR